MHELLVIKKYALLHLTAAREHCNEQRRAQTRRLHGDRGGVEPRRRRDARGGAFADEDYARDARAEPKRYVRDEHAQNESTLELLLAPENEAPYHCVQQENNATRDQELVERLLALVVPLHRRRSNARGCEPDKWHQTDELLDLPGAARAPDPRYDDGTFGGHVGGQYVRAEERDCERYEADVDAASCYG